MASPKTTEVVFKNGTTGRGVKLTEKNLEKLAHWIGNDFIEVRHKKNKDDSVDRSIFFYQNGSRQPRIARIGDTIVKLKVGFIPLKPEDFAKHVKI